MIIDILSTIWVLTFSTLIAVDNTPCNRNLKKAFIFCSSFIVAVLNIALIWTPYLLKGIQ
jgi:hypothetical protein